MSQLYIIVSTIILILLLTFLFFFSKRAKKEPLTPLAGVALGCIIAGMLLGDSRLVSYSFFGTGILLVVADIVLKSKK